MRAEYTQTHIRLFFLIPQGADAVSLILLVNNTNWIVN